MVDLRLSASSIKPHPLLTIGTRNVQSSFQAKDQASQPPCALDGQDVLVIEMGSGQVKMGMARDAFPHTYPAIIAHRNTENDAVLMPPVSLVEPDSSYFSNLLTVRNKQAKKKMPPNHYQSIAAYNRASEPQPISKHNDAFTVEWTTLPVPSVKTVCGLDALNLEKGFCLKRPMVEGRLNDQDYRSWHELSGDLNALWLHGLKQVLKSERKPADLCVVLVVPEGAARWEQRCMVEAALSSFRAVMLVGAAQAASYGSASATCLVVGVGAQCSWVQAVEEGVCLMPAWKQPIGGDHLSALFGWILRQHQFPYSTLDPQDPFDARLLDELKERLCTLDEDELQSGLFECIVRRPGQTTRLYPFKMFEERFLCPHALFEAGIPMLKIRSTGSRTLAAGDFEVRNETEAVTKPAEDEHSDASSTSLDLSSNEMMDEVTVLQAETCMLALDEAILQFLTPMAEQKERLSKLLSSIVLQGGTVKIPSLGRFLLGRLRQQAWERWSIDPSLVDLCPRDLDPRWIGWKGGAVACRLESSSECWITVNEWLNEGPSVIARKVNYPY